MLALLTCVTACSSSRRYHPGELPPEQPSDEGGSAAMPAKPETPQFPETGINASTLTVTGVRPASGPFAGGNQVVVRGSGFTGEALVFFGENMVQPAATQLEDRNSLRVIVPAGRVGVVDVTVQIGTEEAAMAGAYTYSPLLLEPTSGSVAGGTSVLVTIEGARFDAGVEVRFDGEACGELRVVTPTQVRCKTPAGDVGDADVEVLWPNQPGRETLRAQAAFEYVDLTDTDRGGLSGGPISGTLNVTVVDALAGFAVPDAFVLVGDDLSSDYQGRADARGQITFSGPDLFGPLTVHVVAKCMERASIVAFDAQNVTVHLLPLLDPSCGQPGDPPPPGRGTAGSMISGELIFPGSDEFAVNAWDIVPPPRPDEVRVSYVFTTRVQVGAPNPSPAVNGTTARVVELTSPLGVRGYPYRIFARPAGLAVYALSGLERRDSGEFVPYVMGVARDVLTAPGDETAGIDIHMDIPLDREQQVELNRLPARTPRGPDQFRVEAHVDLGGEGIIVREVAGRWLDVITSFTGGAPYRLFAQPAFVGPLFDARYQVIAGWYTGERDDLPPYTKLRRLGAAQSRDPIVLDDLLELPSVVAPEDGAHIPDDRVLRWQPPPVAPDLYLLEIIGGDGLPAWTQIVSGSLSESTIPDFSTVPELVDIPPGVIGWSLRAIRIEDFDFDEFKYNLLSERFWTHTSVDAFTTQR